MPNDSTNATLFTPSDLDTLIRPIGYVRTEADDLPKHWSISDVEGTLEIDPQWQTGLDDLTVGQFIVVLFVFHKSPPFEMGLIKQQRRGKPGLRGIFAICSPKRPNPIGLSVVKVLAIDGNVLKVKGLDMLDGTPIIDIKPHAEIPEDWAAETSG